MKKSCGFYHENIWGDPPGRLEKLGHDRGRWIRGGGIRVHTQLKIIIIQGYETFKKHLIPRTRILISSVGSVTQWWVSVLLLLFILLSVQVRRQNKLQSGFIIWLEPRPSSHPPSHESTADLSKFVFALHPSRLPTNFLFSLQMGRQSIDVSDEEENVFPSDFIWGTATASVRKDSMAFVFLIYWLIYCCCYSIKSKVLPTRKDVDGVFGMPLVILLEHVSTMTLVIKHVIIFIAFEKMWRWCKRWGWNIIALASVGPVYCLQVERKAVSTKREWIFIRRWLTPCWRLALNP